MLRFLTVALVAVLGAVSTVSAEAAPDLTVLRGFRIGQQCQQLEAAYNAMRRDGFDVAPLRFTCNYQAGRFRQDYLLRDVDGRQEYVELFYSADSTLWRVRVTLSWDNAYKLSPSITPAQAESSLRARFGEPITETGDKTSGAKEAVSGVHSRRLTWADALSGLAVPTSFVERLNLLNPLKSSSDANGVVTEAKLTWYDTSPNVALVVDMADRRTLPAAERAARDLEQERAAEQARRDASMLGGL